jgi:hypothetical protein
MQDLGPEGCPTLGMAADFILTGGLRGSGFTSLQHCLFDGQSYLDDLGFLVSLTRWFHFFLLMWVFSLGRPLLGELLSRRDSLPAVQGSPFQAMPSQGIVRTEKSAHSERKDSRPLA